MTAVSCPACGAADTDAVRMLELPPDASSDEITLYALRCPTCDHRLLGVYEESRRGALGEDHWRYQQIECSAAQWGELEAVMAGCPEPRQARCSCSAHQQLGRRNKAGRWRGLDAFLGGEPALEPAPIAVPSPVSPAIVPPPAPSPPAPEIGTNRAIVIALAWSPDGTRLAAASTDGRLAIWSAQPLEPRRTAGARRVQRLYWGDELQSFGPDGIRVWDPEPLTASVRIAALGRSVAAWSSDGARVALGDDTGAVEIFDARSGERVAGHQVYGPGERLEALAWSPDGRSLACGASGPDALRVIDAGTGDARWRRDHATVYYSGSGDPFGFPDEERHAAVHDLAFTPDGRQLVCAGEGEHMTLWSADGEHLANLPANGWTSISAIAISPDGGGVVSIDRRGDARFTPLRGARPPSTFELDAADAVAIAFSPHAEILAVGAAGRDVRIVDPATGVLASWGRT